MRVLIVDDSRTLRATLKRLVKRLECEPVLAESAESAIDLVEDGLEADLVMTDQHMPGRSGADLIGWLRSHAHYGPKPLILLSGEDQSTIDGWARAAGASGWMTKPVRSPDLEAMIRRLRARS